MKRLIEPPDNLLLLGVIAILAAVIFTYEGKVWVRFIGWIYRDKQPFWFWWNVAIYCLVGVCFILDSLSMIYRLSH